MSLFKFFSKNTKGFTVVELMVVVSIIGILSTVTYASFSQAQKKSRIAKRVSDLKQMQVALEYYYAVNKSYPSSGGLLRSECAAWNSGGTITAAANNMIVGLVPNYIPKIPSDPRMVVADNSSCYVYRSDGVDYYIMAYNIIELSSAEFQTQPALIDPARDGGSNLNIVDGSSISAWKVYSSGAASW